MSELPTVDELIETGRASLRVDLDPNGTGAIDLNAGSRLDVALSLNAALGLRALRFTGDRVAASRLASAVDTDLEALALDLFQETRKGDNRATGYVWLQRLGGGAATTIPKGTRVGVPATATKRAIVYQATELFPVASAGGTQQIQVPIEAVEAGPHANLADRIFLNTILDPLEAKWTIVQPESAKGQDLVIAGGADRESDDVLRARLQQLDPLAQRQRGTRAAILGGALRVPGVRYATAVETLDGMVGLWVGDESGRLSSAMQIAIDKELLQWRCYGAPCPARSYTLATVVVSMIVFLQRSMSEFDIVSLRERAVQAVKDYFALDRDNPAEYTRAGIFGAIARALGTDVVQDYDSATFLPATDVLRDTDADYSSGVMTRYVVSDSTISIYFSDPRIAP